MRLIHWLLAVLICFEVGIAHSQTKLISAELKNGCKLELPVRFDATLVAIGTQELSPAGCPGKGHFTGMAAIGMVIKVNFTDGTRDYFFVRTGTVKEGRFEYSLIHNLAPYQGLTWEDNGGNPRSIELQPLRSTDGVNGAKLQLISVGSAYGIPTLDKDALDFVAQRVAEWNRGPEALIKRYTANAKSWISSATTNASEKDDTKSVGDAPKTTGRGAPGG